MLKNLIMVGIVLLIVIIFFDIPLFNSDIEGYKNKSKSKKENFNDFKKSLNKYRKRLDKTTRNSKINNSVNSFMNTLKPKEIDEKQKLLSRKNKLNEKIYYEQFLNQTGKKNIFTTDTIEQRKNIFDKYLKIRQN
jgi:hypothetical protein